MSSRQSNVVSNGRDNQSPEARSIVGLFLLFPEAQGTGHLENSRQHSYPHIGTFVITYFGWQPLASHEQDAKIPGPDAPDACANYFRVA